MNGVSYQFQRGDKVRVAYVSGTGTWDGYVVRQSMVKTAAGEWVPIYEVSDDKYERHGETYGEGELTKIEA